MERPPPLPLKSTKAAVASPSAPLCTPGPQDSWVLALTVGVIMAALDQPLHSNVGPTKDPRSSGAAKV